MKLIDNKIWFSPTDLSQFYASPFASWMTRFQIENPGEKFDIEPDPTMQLLAKRGDEHELKYLAHLKSEAKSIIEINKNQKLEIAAEDTIKAMQTGADIIYQGALVKDNFRGYTDFMVKVNKPSKMGDYSYDVWDTKLALSPKPEYILQLSCYSEMLAEIQGHWPENLSIVLGDNSKVDFRINDFKSYYKKFKKTFIEYHQNFNSKKRPMPEVWESLGDWQEIGDEILKQQDHLIQVAGMAQTQIKKFEQAGIKTMQQLADAQKTQKPEKMQQSTFDKLNRQALLQKQTEKLQKTQFELRNIETKQSYGLQKLPPAHPSDVYFDMEGFPLIEKGLEYLFGATYEENNKIVFKDWWALNRQEEKIAFESWIDWVFARFKKCPQMHIYHYAAYEVTAMKKLMGEHMTRVYEVDELLRNQVFVDLYQVVREGLIVGASSYSIKKLEDLYDFKRTADVKKAGDSVVQFANWLELKDGADYKTSIILKEIRDYNEEDCVSTLHLTNWLRKLQKENKINYVGFIKEEEEVKPRTPADDLQQKMQEVLIKDATTEEVHKILTAAIGYHNREAKPQWWVYFDRQRKLPEELVDDMECLASCKIIKKTGDLYTVQFDPEQESKVSTSSQLVLHHNVKMKVGIEEINYDDGTAILEIKTDEPLTSFITLMPSGPIKTESIEAAIYSNADDWNKHNNLQKLKPALADLLARNNPRFTDKRMLVFQSMVDDDNFLAEVIDSCKKLDESVLAIQGPPGTGKTYTASHIIAELLMAKKKVGITSNSHKAINNLIEKVNEVLIDKKIRDQFTLYKINSKKEDEFLAKTKCEYAAGATQFFKKKNHTFDLIGGTSWFFSATGAVDQFDYLFIEEAGQFSLANAIATQRSAKNLVLLGDQMQLEQPMQGTHPDEISESALGHYLKDIAAVTPDKGVFLGQSRRMHPDVCSFISEMVYESKLNSHESTSANKVEIVNSEYIKKPTGLIFVPVQHEGNAQSSDEEVEVIQKIAKELSKAKLYRLNKTESFSLNNCLFVAPYNVQVGKIKSALGETARVGSVDLFQGQEADIVILSMCSSDGEVSPRGLDFLLNKNRLNVAVSRAKTLAIVVGSEKLVESRAKSIKSMALLNLFCSVVGHL